VEAVETIADRYRRRADAFSEKVAAVPADRWDAPSPCEDWKAIDVVKHVAETPGLFFGFIDADFVPPPAVEDDPLASFQSTSRQLQAALDDPSVAQKEFDGFFGRTTFEQAVDRFISFDLVVHGWDLAQAAGLDDRMDPDDVAALQEAAPGFGEAARSPGVFGPELEAPADADDQAKLLAFLGRKPIA
jgi:uncharacterized protein (TIGR03086 family)